MPAAASAPTLSPGGSWTTGSASVGSLRSGVGNEWMPSSTMSQPLVQGASVGGGEMLLRGQDIRGRSLEFLCTDRSEVTVQVTAYGSLGRLVSGSTLSLTQTVDFASLAPPSDVTALRLEGRTFSWDTVPDIDVAGYRIKFHYNNRTSWGDANDLHAGLLTQTPHTFQELPADVITYLIKAVDAADIESNGIALVTVDYRNFSPEGDPLVANVVETFDFDALGWSGTITGGAIHTSIIAVSDGDKSWATIADSSFGAPNACNSCPVRLRSTRRRTSWMSVRRSFRYASPMLSNDSRIRPMTRLKANSAHMRL